MLNPNDTVKEELKKEFDEWYFKKYNCYLETNQFEWFYEKYHKMWREMADEIESLKSIIYEIDMGKDL